MKTKSYQESGLLLIKPKLSFWIHRSVSMLKQYSKVNCRPKLRRQQEMITSVKAMSRSFYKQSDEAGKLL